MKRIEVIGKEIAALKNALQKLEEEKYELEHNAALKDAPIKVGDVVTWQTGWSNKTTWLGKVTDVRSEYSGFRYEVRRILKSGGFGEPKWMWRELTKSK